MTKTRIGMEGAGKKMNNSIHLAVADEHGNFIF